MAKHTFEITIEANNENEAITKMTALTILAGKLNPKELEKLAHIVKNDPIKTALAKKYMGL
jgi:hypothetical protein